MRKSAPCLALLQRTAPIRPGRRKSLTVSTRCRCITAGKLTGLEDLRADSSTSSNTSAFSQNTSPMRPSLSRAHRSGSLAIAKPLSVDRSAEHQITGSAEERELHVRSLLADKAISVKAAPPGTQRDKLRTLWVRQWSAVSLIRRAKLTLRLHLCYKEAHGYTVPRQGLYASYELSCKEYGVKAINSASFGKAVRNAYPSIRTRRLGHRGNSKYHYVALRPAIRLEAMRLNEYGDSSGQVHRFGVMCFRLTAANGTSRPRTGLWGSTRSRG